MSKRIQKKTPYLAGYFTWLLAKAAQERGGSAEAIGCAGTLIGVPLLSYFAGNLLGPAAAGVAAMGGLAAAMYLMWRLNRQRKKPKTEEQARAMAALGHVKEMESLLRQRKLHRWVDPAILQLLEAGAFHWTRIRAVLDSHDWASESSQSQYGTIRDQAALASERAMTDLVLVAANCVGPPQKDQQAQIKDIVEDFFDLDIADALAGLKQISDSDWTAYAHRSPNARLAFEQGQGVALGLKRLADRLEATRPVTTVFEVPTNPSVSSLERVLGELDAVKAAEAELENRLGQG